MCWMVVSKAGNKVNTEYMDKAQKHNEDGYGVAWFENGYVNTYKSFDYEQFKAVCVALEKHTLVIHLRYATKGDKTLVNVHPFNIPTGVMFHNGTMWKAPKDANLSDSNTLAELISRCEFETITDIEPLIEPYIDDAINRLVFFEDDGKITIMNEHLGIEEDNGDWYSNDYHLKDEGWCRAGACKKPKPKKDIVATVVKPLERDNLVFVYGTLKDGGRNSPLLSQATFLGDARTKSKWTMIGNGYSFPYVLEMDYLLGGNIQGEVYAVNSVELERLDTLEGVPTHYKKVKTKVIYEVDGIEEEVTMYVKAKVDPAYRKDKSKLITNWEV